MQFCKRPQVLNAMPRYEPDTVAAVRDLRSVRDFVRWTVTCLAQGKVHLGHGNDDAWDEAMALVLHPLALDWDSDPRVLDARLTVPEREAIAALVRRRVTDRVPLAYLTGKAWFAGLPFLVDERVLVPRSPIAELINARFEPWLDAARVQRVLELCTGSGCIAVACCHAFPDAEVVATDISADALEVATENRALHHCDEQLALVQGDLYAGVHGRYDLVIANPPYVDARDMAGLPAEYRHEPELGLAAGDDGLDLVLRILADADHFLADDGLLVVEVGNSDVALMQLFPVVPFIWPEFEQGEGGVFALQAADVRAAAAHFRAAAAART
jgi:ribosomal protein L3 glutamine methyltransferase